MHTKGKIGTIIQIIILPCLLFVTIRLSGHKHSGGILAIGLLFIDMVALIIGVILSRTKIVKPKMHFIFMGLIVMTFTIFILYHASYDSYNETRRLFWGLNGEGK